MKTDYLEKYLKEKDINPDTLDSSIVDLLRSLQEWNNNRCDFSGREMLLSGEKKSWQKQLSNKP